ncbi:MAG: apolipoprotein N-acyltransferase [Proteobacteria bacterium]|nr:apolipoprotein N-acyltransferase [Pseudomonadota bacterium]
MNRPANLKIRLAGLTGWRRSALLAGLGVAAAMALPPVHGLPLLIPAFVGLLWAVETSPGPGRAFTAGWWFGVGHFAAGLAWISFAFFVDAPRYGWMAPFAVAGMAAGMALFPAAAAILSYLVFERRLTALGRVLVFGALWMLTEWLRGWVLTGFPWNLLGTVWVFSDAMVQLAALTGVYGLSLLAVVAAAMPAVLAEPVSGGGERNRWMPVLAAAGVLALVWAGGEWRLAGAGNDTVPGVRLRLVQPNIPQNQKWKRELRWGHVLKQLEMSNRPAPPGRSPTLVIWAETAVPFVISGPSQLTRALGRAAPPGGLVIVGAPRTVGSGAASKELFNSILAIDSQGRIKGVYDKHHLVPFGEYVPLRSVLAVGKLTAGRQDFSPGPGVRTLALDGLPPFSPLICYEVIFPGRVAEKNNSPQWLLNLTNDAWFGFSSGPYQHFAAARLRAVEEGLPLVRVANTGISGVIDPYGRVVRRLGLGREGIIDSPLPVETAYSPPFSRLGPWMTGLIFIMAFGFGFLLTPIGSLREDRQAG